MDELTKEVQALCRYLVGIDIIEFEFNNDGPDEWKCPFCFATVPVVYIRPTRESPSIERSFPRSEPCDVEYFPHTQDCQVWRARHILALLTIPVPQIFYDAFKNERE